MSFSGTSEATALGVAVDEESVSVDLTDGRTITVPLSWYPRLLHGSSAERANWRLISRGGGIHWPDLDEDIRVESLLEGRRSGEGAESLGRWLSGRDAL